MSIKIPRNNYKLNKQWRVRNRVISVICVLSRIGYLLILYELFVLYKSVCLSYTHNCNVCIFYCLRRWWWWQSDVWYHPITCCRYITTTEWSAFFGGYKKKSHTGANAAFRRLPLTHCCLSLLPFNHPYIDQQGNIYDLEAILPFVKKFKINPVTGEVGQLREPNLTIGFMLG